ncbi:hypothetical protein GCM10023084_70460 [Streptomyces lacrimifluminis]|uniref:Uncharacterized protein n=1 Tax=Streptomyces lacrimifluminis TaxID=1500077 RepID=A0A917L565_9ACTN|nr:hypothetical protein [Streptomyces lacrimifluminis]GGJ43494.1 hypothetical protein GCM10012282_45460 [Streptomyces lacrimifluminis]
MDQGLAAVLGATVGVLGTVSASAISGWSARQQVQSQAKIEHAQWRRQTRRDAYSAFLAPANEARTTLKIAARALIGDNPDLPEADRRLQVAQEQLAVVQAAWAGLAVEGPEPVEQAAHSVRTGLHSMRTTLLAWRDSMGAPDLNVTFVERHAVEATRISERIGRFTAAARTALDDTESPSGV